MNLEAKRVKPQISEAEVQAMAVAAIVQCAYNPTDTRHYMAGTVATSIERCHDRYTPIDPPELYRFTPTYARVFKWHGSIGYDTEMYIVDLDPTTRQILDHTHERAIANILFGEHGSFEIHDLLNCRTSRGEAGPCPRLVQLYGMADGMDSCDINYRVGTTDNSKSVMP